MPEARYFELNDDVGLAPSHLTHPETGEPVENPAAGTPEPLREVSLQLATPTMVGGQLAQTTQTVVLQPIPGTRILKVDDALVASALAGHPLYHEIEAPSKKALTEARKSTEDAREAGKEVES